MTTRVLCALSALLLAGPAWAATPCASLKSLTLPNVTITAAEAVPAGPFVQPGRARGRPWWRTGGAAADAAGLLPRGGDADAFVGL
jgi:hypothetical protein